MNKYIEFYRHIPSNLKRRILLLAPMLSISSILEVVSLAALIPLINLILEPSSGNRLFIFFNLQSLTDKEKVGFLFAVFIALVIIKGVFVFLVSKYTFLTSAKIKAHFQNILFAGYLHKDFIKQLESNSAHYIRNITTECNQLEGRLVMPGLTLLGEFFPVLSICLFLCYLNPIGVAIAFCVFFISGLLITKTTSTCLKKYGGEQLYSDGMQVKIAKEAFGALKEIKLYRKQNKLFDVYSKYVDTSAILITKALVLGQIPKFVLEIIGLLTIFVIAFVAFSKGASANQVLVELAIFMGAVTKLLPAANRIVMNFQSLTHARPAIENILKELRENDHVVESPSIDSYMNGDGGLTVSFQDVSFKYGHKKSHVLDNINFSISIGQIVGIRGESGSGKSTIINLILGFLKPSSGEILVDGLQIENCLRSWQNKISYVPQDVVLFDDTLRNNVLFFDENIQNTELGMVLSRLRLDSLVESMENGLDTVVGENGSALSGGQKQRIGIARAIVRKPKLIVFDEATSALDSETEEVVNSLIKELSRTCMVLIIAHKQSALEICDKIYTIKNKSLIAE